MNTLEHDIFQYPDLSKDEQRSVEERTAGRAKYEALLSEVKRLDGELRRIRLPHASADGRAVPDALLALYALNVADSTRASGSSVLQQFFADLKERLSHDAALRDRVEPMIDRAQALNDTFDVSSHMQEVTGINLERMPRHQDGTEGLRRERQSPSSTHASVGPGPEAGARTDRDSAPRHASESRSPVRSAVARLWKKGRYAVAVLAVVVVAYGGLLAASTAMQSPAERLAVLDPDETQIEGYQVRTRSAAAAPAGNDERFLQALKQLRDAYSAPLGLFPRFDDNRVQEAQDALERVVKEEEAGSFLQLEASFFLAKTYLAQSNIEAARRELKRVVMGEGRRIDEATRMLKSLQHHYPMEAPELPDGVQL